MSVSNTKGYFIRRAKERGHLSHGWLDTFHTFSFADYHDPNYMGFRTLRVINEDTIAPGQGFGTHAHDNMEIITVMLKGEIAHKDSMGNEHIIHEHEIQAMSAGTGVRHSEYNPSKTNSSHLLQIWIIPDTKGIKPRYQEKKLPQKVNTWILLASKTGEQDSLPIQQDVKLYTLSLAPGSTIDRQLDANRYGWIQVMEGDLTLNDEQLHAGDGVALDQELRITLKAEQKEAKLLFFDLN